METITHFDPLTGEALSRLDTITIFPATQYVTSKPTIERAMVELRQELTDQVRSFEAEGACSRPTASGNAPSTTSR